MPIFNASDFEAPRCTCGRCVWERFCHATLAMPEPLMRRARRLLELAAVEPKLQSAEELHHAGLSLARDAREEVARG